MTSFPKSSLADDGFKDGPEGLKYKDITVGKGDSPVPKNKVLVDFVLKVKKNEMLNEYSRDGMKDDGTFNSRVLQNPLGGSYEIELGTDSVIKGLDLGVLGGGDMPPMLAGGTRRLIIPPELAFGEQGNGCPNSIYVPKGPCIIEPNAVIDLTVDLARIKGASGGDRDRV